MFGFLSAMCEGVPPGTAPVLVADQRGESQPLRKIDNALSDGENDQPFVHIVPIPIWQQYVFKHLPNMAIELELHAETVAGNTLNRRINMLFTFPTGKIHAHVELPASLCNCRCYDKHTAGADIFNFSHQVAVSGAAVQLDRYGKSTSRISAGIHGVVKIVPCLWLVNMEAGFDPA